jgi:hypothetical protein
VKVGEAVLIDVRFHQMQHLHITANGNTSESNNGYQPLFASSDLGLKMAQTRKGKDKRMFIIELRSKGDVKSVSLDGDEKVLIEGSIGSLKQAQFLEDLVLEVIGSNGVLRMDLAMKDLEHSIKSEESKKDRGSNQ